MNRLALLLVILTGCYRYVGKVETERYSETSRCGGTYQTVTRCDAVVGPWPSMTVNYPNCVTGDP